MFDHFIPIPLKDLRETVFAAENELDSIQHHKRAIIQDIVPGTTASVLVSGKAGLQLAIMQWGISVTWQKSGVFNIPYHSANKRIWANSTQHRRCLVPSYGFYGSHKATIHTQAENSSMSHCLFNLPRTSVLMMAGIYKDNCFSIITTKSNEWVFPVCKTMPVVLRQNEWKQWLSPNYASLYDRSDVELISKLI